MEDLSLHVLDVAENALVAGADRIEVRIFELPKEDVLKLEIEDNGTGMDRESMKRALDPFYTTKPSKRIGLGLPMLAQAAKEASGEMEIQTAPGKGSLIRATFQLTHPDIKPMGDMLQSIVTLACAHPHVQFTFEHQRDDAVISQWDSGSAKLGRI